MWFCIILLLECSPQTVIHVFESWRREALNRPSRVASLEVKVLGSEHRNNYHHRRPHSSLGDLTPAEFAEHCLAPRDLSTSSKRPPLRKTASPTRNTNQISHDKWINLRGHSTRLTKNHVDWLHFPHTLKSMKQPE